MRLVFACVWLAVLSPSALVAAETRPSETGVATEALAKDVAAPSTSPVFAFIKQVLEVVENAGNLGYGLLLLFFFCVVCLSLPTTPVELSAGFIYGPIWGCVAGVIGKTVGCLIAFYIGQFLGKKMGWKVPEALQSRMPALKSQPLVTMIGIRVAPLPLGVKNYGLALCEVPVSSYVSASLIVNIPFSCLWGSLGASCASLGDALNFDTSKVSFLGAVPSWAKALIATAVLLGVGYHVMGRMSKKPEKTA